LLDEVNTMKSIRTTARSCAVRRVRGVRLGACALGLATGSIAAPGALAQTIMQPNISVAQARQIVDAVIAKCGSAGTLLTVSVAVVDRTGLPIMQLRGDTAAPHSWELAYRKAYTARTFQRTTLEWRDRTAGDSPLAGQRQLTDVIALGGGVPIKRGSETLGAVGVSGAAGGQEGDNACAVAGAAAIADQLK
jgi:uncharacterized protein GlcG (DUF336 family)